MGFCHNDLHASSCLLHQNLNLKAADFGRATTIGQPLRGLIPPRATPIRAGPLRGTYGLCSAATEQFAVGTLLYFMVYGLEPYDDEIIPSAAEWDCRFGEMEYPELNRHEVVDGLISAYWYNVYPTMALLAYDFIRKTTGIAGASDAEYIQVDSVKETRTCKALVCRGLLRAELALHFQPVWRRCRHNVLDRIKSIWKYFLRKIWSWSY
ncbi:hypothetical protein BJY01DRAFT_219706 [Aspergillus pseudoustus]|uniref:Protein kinase domain-containing protein n=1 Tax=Aspergillus pseudoustus TaxID=1810923 RepID=A0ABR4JFH2_9EURO